MGKKSGSGSGIRDEQPESYFLELRNHFLGLNYLNSFMRIRDPVWKKFGSGMEKSRIRDPGSRIRDPGSGIQDPGFRIRDREKHPGSATLLHLCILKIFGGKLKGFAPK
jgi:hypothetical protein